MSENTSPRHSASFASAPVPSLGTIALLADAVRRRDATQPELRNVIEGCVRLLRDQGMTAGAMLITMKALVRQSMEQAPPLGHHPSADVAESLMDRIVSWCVEEFYRTAKRS
jgi:hypothetical protein